MTLIRSSDSIHNANRQCRVRRRQVWWVTPGSWWPTERTRQKSPLTLFTPIRFWPAEPMQSIACAGLKHQTDRGGETDDVSAYGFRAMSGRRMSEMMASVAKLQLTRYSSKLRGSASVARRHQDACNWSARAQDLVCPCSSPTPISDRLRTRSAVCNSGCAHVLAGKSSRSRLPLKHGLGTTMTSAAHL